MGHRRGPGQHVFGLGEAGDEATQIANCARVRGHAVIQITWVRLGRRHVYANDYRRLYTQNLQGLQHKNKLPIILGLYEDAQKPKVATRALASAAT